MKIDNKLKNDLIKKIEEAINAPTIELNRTILKEIEVELEYASNEKQTLKAIAKLIELLGVLAKAYFGST